MVWTVCLSFLSTLEIWTDGVHSSSCTCQSLDILTTELLQVHLRERVWFVILTGFTVPLLKTLVNRMFWATITGNIKGSVVKNHGTLYLVTLHYRELRKTINKQINECNYITSNKTMISFRNPHDPLKRSLSCNYCMALNNSNMKILHEVLISFWEPSYDNTPLYRPSMITAALVYFPFTAKMRLALVYCKRTFNPCFKFRNQRNSNNLRPHRS